MDKIKPFQYWVQKTLPAVYDDSLSYYQLLAKIVHHLNTIGDSQNVVIDKVKELMNWFDNLDVQEEVDFKLDKMAQDGTLDQIINHNIFNDLNEEITNLDSKINSVESTTTQQINNLQSTVNQQIGDLSANVNNQLNVINQSLNEKVGRTEFEDTVENRRPLSFERVKFIAHRGFSWLAPENSKAAFYFAGSNRGAFWGVETDIHSTKDGHWICMHDPTIDRTTNGTGYVKDLTLAQIQQYTIDYIAPSQIPIHDTMIDKKVPTLDDYLSIMSEMNLVPVIEIKSDGDFLALYYMIKRHGFEDKCVVISFYPEYLKALRAHSKQIKMMLLSSYFMPEDIEACKEIGNCGISVDYSKMSAENINIARTHGLEFGVWTVDDIPTIVHARRLGVDYITTNMGAGRFVNKEKRIALTTIDNRLAVAQAYSSENATLTWHDGYQAVEVKYEYPFPAMFAGAGTTALLSQHTGTINLGYEFTTRAESFDKLYLQVKKNGSIINPLSNLADTIWINILVPCY